MKRGAPESKDRDRVDRPSRGPPGIRSGAATRGTPTAATPQSSRRSSTAVVEEGRPSRLIAAVDRETRRPRWCSGACRCSRRSPARRRPARSRKAGGRSGAPAFGSDVVQDPGSLRRGAWPVRTGRMFALADGRRSLLGLGRSRSSSRNRASPGSSTFAPRRPRESRSTPWGGVGSDQAVAKRAPIEPAPTAVPTTRPGRRPVVQRARDRRRGRAPASMWLWPVAVVVHAT
jgi:hypothetical protein